MNHSIFNVFSLKECAIEWYAHLEIIIPHARVFCQLPRSKNLYRAADIYPPVPGLLLHYAPSRPIQYRVIVRTCGTVEFYLLFIFLDIYYRDKGKGQTCFTKYSFLPYFIKHCLPRLSFLAFGIVIPVGWYSIYLSLSIYWKFFIKIASLVCGKYKKVYLRCLYISVLTSVPIISSLINLPVFSSFTIG